MAIDDALTTHTFQVDLGNIQVETLKTVSGLSIGEDVIEIRSRTTVQDLVDCIDADVAQPGEIKLVLTADQAKTLTEAKETAKGTDGQDAVLTIFDRGGEPVQRIHLSSAWASRWEGPSLGTTESGPATETVTITYEDITVE
ncbi:phage tail protein [Streptomyces sp. NPDC056669]|uniref:phage tail protein n=1 Tax=Streptomyces sp. NPDC056669 TaxID=3345903 RepID=UPI0036C938DE